MLQKVKSFFLRQKKPSSCDSHKKPSLRKTPICKICFEPIEDNSLHSLLYSNSTICHKCFNLFKPVFKRFYVGKYNALALYNYDELIQEKLYQFKGCFDIELGTIFIEYFKLFLKLKYWDYVVVPAPSYSSKDEERGFNHVDIMFSSLGLKIVKCIHKVKDIKQADLSFEDRQQIGKALIIDKTNELHGKKVLIVDDVFTTGSTVKAMINLLEKNEPKKIKILVMSKTLSPQEKGL